MLPEMTVSSRDNLTSRVHQQLRESLILGRFWPGQRLRIREVAAAMGVSDTPVREAMMQLVREGGLEMRSGQSINVVKLTLARYLELREIRLLLEGLATEKATPNVTPALIAQLEGLHATLIESERSQNYERAIGVNSEFHFAVYRASRSADLIAILEGIWLRNGPLMKLLYPHAAPTYAGRHQHLAIIEGLRDGDAAMARRAMQDDSIEGGKGIVALLQRIDRGEAAIVETDDGRMELKFMPAGAPRLSLAR